MHLVARSARYWMKERGVMKMQVEYLLYPDHWIIWLSIVNKEVNEPNEPTRLVDDLKWPCIL